MREQEAVGPGFLFPFLLLMCCANCVIDPVTWTQDRLWDQQELQGQTDPELAPQPTAFPFPSCVALGKLSKLSEALAVSLNG